MITKYYIITLSHKVVAESFNKKELEQEYERLFNEEREDIDFVYKQFPTLVEYKKFSNMPKDIFNLGLTVNLFELDYIQATSLRDVLKDVGLTRKANEIDQFILMNLGFEVTHDFDIAKTGGKLTKGDIYLAHGGFVHGVEGVPFIDRNFFKPVFITTEKLEKCVNFETED